MRYDVTGFEHGNANEMAVVFLNGEPHKIGPDCAVMQFTGLTDRNGTDIYEGDVIEAPLGQFEILYSKAAFVRKTIFVNTEGGERSSNVMDPIHTLYSTNGIESCKVIGNIHEPVNSN